MKLKTLKDFENKQNDATISRIELKAEAVKWVKNCSCEKIKIKIKDNDEPIREEYHRDYCFACLRFILFFNLTEKDLK